MRAILLLFVLAAPTASACSWAVPPPLSPLAWTDDGHLVGAQWRTWYDVTGAPRFLADGEAVLSPDLRFAAVLQRGDPPPWQTYADSCGGHEPRYPVGADVANGTFRLLSRERVWGVEATREHAVFRADDELLFFAWGTWELARAVRIPLPTPDFAPTSFLLSEDGTRLLARGHREWAALDVGGARAIELARMAEPGAPMLLSADGRGLLAVERDGSGPTRLVARDTDTLVERAATNLSTAAWPERFAWGPGVIAAASTRYEDDRPVAEVRVFNDALEPIAPLRRFEGVEAGGVAWSPDGARLAVSLGRAGGNEATLLTLDRDLATLEERDVLLTADTRAWHEALDAQAPAPDWDAEQVAREVPAASVAPVLALALAVALALARRR